MSGFSLNQRAIVRFIKVEPLGSPLPTHGSRLFPPGNVSARGSFPPGVVSARMVVSARGSFQPERRFSPVGSSQSSVLIRDTADSAVSQAGFTRDSAESYVTQAGFTRDSAESCVTQVGFTRDSAESYLKTVIIHSWKSDFCNLFQGVVFPSTKLNNIIIYMSQLRVEFIGLHVDRTKSAV